MWSELNRFLLCRVRSPFCRYYFSSLISEEFSHLCARTWSLIFSLTPCSLSQGASASLIISTTIATVARTILSLISMVFFVQRIGTVVRLHNDNRFGIGSTACVQLGFCASTLGIARTIWKWIGQISHNLVIVDNPVVMENPTISFVVVYISFLAGLGYPISGWKKGTFFLIFSFLTDRNLLFPFSVFAWFIDSLLMFFQQVEFILQSIIDSLSLLLSYNGGLFSGTLAGVILGIAIGTVLIVLLFS